MRILLLHPEDGPLEGPWAWQRWDAVFDLGRGGESARERWSHSFGCPVNPLDDLKPDNREISKVRELLKAGLGRLVDEEGLDWWELTAIEIHERLESLVRLRELVDELPPQADVSLSRGGFYAEVLKPLLGTRLHVIPGNEVAAQKRLRHYWNRLRQLPMAHVLQTLGDKYDMGYRVRRHFHRRPLRGTKPLVLLPSPYVNVSRLGVAYARLLPEMDFLLASTRSSGRLPEVPANVRQVWLAAYAPGTDTTREYRDLLSRWEKLKRELIAIEEWRMAEGFGLLANIPRHFAAGLAVREAWRQVLEAEPVQAVLCGDDSNPQAHIPLLLARKRGLPVVTCHHGALDGRHLIKISHADVILAKGRMEQDYLVHVCGVKNSVVEIGAPGALPQRPRTDASGDTIVYFSEPYEMALGRTQEFYRDILPGLAELSRRHGKKLVLKLHPSENLENRRKIMQAVLTREDCERIEIVNGGLTDALLDRTWFGITVLSSVVVDCTVRGIPCFVCSWLNCWPYGYVDQYRKFGVGIGLKAPAEIANIPERMASFRPSPEAAAACWESITPERLREILSKSNATVVAGSQSWHSS